MTRRAAQFDANRRAMAEAVAELRRREAAVREGGGEEAPGVTPEYVEERTEPSLRRAPDLREMEL